MIITFVDWCYNSVHHFASHRWRKPVIYFYCNISMMIQLLKAALDVRHSPQCSWWYNRVSLCSHSWPWQQNDRIVEIDQIYWNKEYILGWLKYMTQLVARVWRFPLYRLCLTYQSYKGTIRQYLQSFVYVFCNFDVRYYFRSLHKLDIIQ